MRNDSNSKVTLWKQKLKKSIDIVTLNCIARKQDESNDTLIFKQQIKNVPKCLYSISRPVCKCQNKCLRDIKKLIKPLLKNCPFYNKNAFSDNYSDCKGIDSFVKLRHTSFRFDFERYFRYGNVFIFDEGYKLVIEAFCNKQMKKSDFKCYMFSFRDYCVPKFDCNKFTEHLILIDCLSSRFNQAVIMIDDIFGRSIFDENFRNKRSIGYHEKNKSVDDPILNNDFNLFKTNVAYFKGKINSNIGTIFKDRKLKKINTFKKNISNRQNNFEVNYDNFSKTFRNNPNVPNDQSTIAINILEWSNNSNNLNSSINPLKLDQNFYIETEVNQIFHMNNALSSIFYCLVLFLTFILSLILYKRKNLKRSILSIVLTLMLISNLVALTMITFFK